MPSRSRRARHRSSRAIVFGTIDDLSRLSEIKSLVAAMIGATLQQVRYDVRDRSSIEAEAMLAALADARTQIETLAARSNVHIGAQRSLQTNVNGGNQNLDRAAVRIEASASATYDISSP